MRPILAVLALMFVAGDASAAPMDLFTGRPYAAGVVQGGIFGTDGADYYGEAHQRPLATSRKPGEHASSHRVARSTGTGMSPVVPRPYRP